MKGLKWKAYRNFSVSIINSNRIKGMFILPTNRTTLTSPATIGFYYIFLLYEPTADPNLYIYFIRASNREICIFLVESIS